MALNIHVPFFIAAGAVLAGIGILSTIHAMLADAERAQAAEVGAALAPPRERVVAVSGGASTVGAGPASVIVAAVDDSPIAGLVTEAAAQLARHDGRAVHVVHAPEAAVGGDVAVDGAELQAARAVVLARLDQLAACHIPAAGQVLLHAADHGAVGRLVADYANGVGAATIVVGVPTHGGLPAAMDASTTRELLRNVRSNVLIINPEAPAALDDASGGPDRRIETVPTPAG
jgi:MFS transporter, ACDE family, multidrug resistance protein